MCIIIIKLYTKNHLSYHILLSRIELKHCIFLWINSMDYFRNFWPTSLLIHQKTSSKLKKTVMRSPNPRIPQMTLGIDTSQTNASILTTLTRTWRDLIYPGRLSLRRTCLWSARAVRAPVWSTCMTTPAPLAPTRPITACCGRGASLVQWWG